MGGCGQLMQTHGEGLLVRIGTKVDRAGEDLSYQGPRIVMALEFLACDLHQHRLGPISNQLDGIHEMFLGGAQLRKALGFGEIFVLGLELIQCYLALRA